MIKLKTIFVFVVLSTVSLTLGQDKIIQQKSEQMLYPMVRIKSHKSVGSGTIVYSEDRDKKGCFDTFIITNHHVVDSSIRIEKKWNNLLQRYEDQEATERVLVEIFRYLPTGEDNGREQYDANIVAYDADEDIAVLQLTVSTKMNYVAKILPANYASPQVFDVVYSVGCSLSHAPIPTNGEITSINEILDRKSYWMISSPIVFGNCLKGDSMVYTEFGPIPIKDVKEGTNVWTINENTLQLEKKKVLANICSGVKDLVEIKSRNRKIKLSYNHPVLTCKFIGKERNKNKWEMCWKEVGKMEVGDVFVSVSSLPSDNITTLPTGRECSINMAKFFGAMIGDGYIRIRPREGSSFHLCTYDLDFHNKYDEIIKSELGLYSSYKGTTNWYNSEFAKELRDLGFSSKATQKVVPQYVWAFPEDYRLAFLEGYYDADGSLLRNGGMCFEANNIPLIQQMRALAISCGLRVSNTFIRTRIIKEICGFKLLKDNYTSASFQAYSIGVPKFVFGKYGLPELGNHLHWERIAKINKIDSDITYDLHIDGNHNFIADGIVVHNSGGAVFLLREGKFWWIGVPSRVAAMGDQIVPHMAYMMPLDRINNWISSQKLNFLTDPNATPISCFKNRTKLRYDSPKFSLQGLIQSPSSQPQSTLYKEMIYKDKND